MEMKIRNVNGVCCIKNEDQRMKEMEKFFVQTFL